MSNSGHRAFERYGRRVEGSEHRDSRRTSCRGRIDDRHAEFLMAVGGMCVAAELANLAVVVRTAGGARVAGVPAVRAAAGGDEFADTGYARTFRVDDMPINLDEVVSCTIHTPAPAHLRRPSGVRRIDPR
jgi:hypothetical protein